MDINSKGLPQSSWLSSRKRPATRLNSSSTQGDQEAGTKRFSRLIHNPRLAHEVLAYRHRGRRALPVFWRAYDQSAQRTDEACHLITRRLKLACVEKSLRSRNND
jgi:hypothetical protein